MYLQYLLFYYTLSLASFIAISLHFNGCNIANCDAAPKKNNNSHLNTHNTPKLLQILQIKANRFLENEIREIRLHSMELFHKYSKEKNHLNLEKEKKISKREWHDLHDSYVSHVITIWIRSRIIQKKRDFIQLSNANRHSSTETSIDRATFKCQSISMDRDIFFYWSAWNAFTTTNTTMKTEQTPTVGNAQHTYFTHTIWFICLKNQTWFYPCQITCIILN